MQCKHGSSENPNSNVARVVSTSPGWLPNVMIVKRAAKTTYLPVTNSLRASAPLCRVIEQVWQRLWLRARIVAYRKRSITSSEGFNSSGMETSGSQRKRINLFVTGAFMAPIHTPQETLFLSSGAFRQ
jgi:hypothetical protein